VSAWLEVQGLGKRFGESGRPVLENVSFSVDRGEFLALIGPSGCGKSTLLHIVAGLSRSTTGTVRLNGVPVESPRREMMFVFQQYSKSIFPWKTVLDNVLLGIRYQPDAGSRVAMERRARDQLELVGLAEFADYRPYQLSGGMQQRVAIARALVRRPDILLMDEPFSALDAMMRADLQDLLRRLWRELGLTVVFVTHDLDEALYLAQRVLVLSAGPGRIARTVPVPLPEARGQVETRSDPVYLDLRSELFRAMTGSTREVHPA